MTGGASLKIKVQLMLGEEIALGPGKVDLLEWVARAGSISGAAKGMGLSYRRAWLMIDTVNRCFEEPLVRMAHGGSKGGGAALTPAGQAVVAAYRDIQARVESAAQADGLIARLRKTPAS